MTREDAERLLESSREPGFLERAPEGKEVERAVRWFAANGEAESVAELAGNTWRIWLVSGEVATGRRVLAVALDAGEGKPSRARAFALYGDGVLAFRADAMADSQTRNEEALETARAAGDREAEALALVGLSRVALRAGDYTRVRALAAQARELTRALEPGAAAAPLHLLAAGTRLAGDYDEAAALYDESLELARRLGDSRSVGMELHNLGHVELHRGNAEVAQRHFAERRDVCNPDDPYDTAMTYLNEAAVALASGERDRAAELLTQSESTLEGAGIVLDPDDAFEVEWLRSRLA